MPKIRFATVADIPVIYQLICELAEFEKLSHEVKMTEDILQKNLFSQRTCAEILIAEEAGNALGFALFFHNFSTFLGLPGIYLEDLYVRAEFRKKGIGRTLLAELAQIAVDRNCGRLEWQVLDWNEKAIQLYRQLGATPLNEWTTFRLQGEKLKSLCASVQK